MRKGPGSPGALRSSSRIGSERALDLLRREDLDHVALADVLVVLEGHAAFLSGPDLLHLVLEALESLELSFVDHDVVAQQTDPGVAPGHALGDLAARDLADARDLEDLLDLRIADEGLPHLGLQQTRRRRLHVVHQVVDHRIIADFHTLLVRGLARRGVGPDVEADHRHVTRLGEADIGLRDRADARMHDPHPHVLVADLLQRLDDRLGRALNVRLHQHRQLGHVLVGLRLRQQLVQRRAGARGRLLLLRLALTIVGDLARLGLAVDDVQHVAGLGRALQAQHLDRRRGAGLVDPLALVVDQRAHPAPLLADDEDVAALQRAPLHQHRRHRAAARVQLRLDHGALGGAAGVGLQLQDLGLQRDGLEQLVQARARHGGDLDVLHVARHRLDDDLVLQQVGPHLLRIGSRLVALVDGDDHRHLRRLGVVQRLDRLRHHRIVRRHDQNHDVRDLGATGAHRGEGRVTRRVEERDRRARGRAHLIGADVLRDAPGLAGDHVRLPDLVQERGLAVVDMAHDRDHRRTRLQILVLVLVGDDGLLDVGLRDAHDVVPELLDQQLRRLGVERVVDRDHRAVLEQRLHQVRGALGHAVGELLHRDRVGHVHVAHDLLALLAAAALTLLTLLLAAHRGERALTPALVVAGGAGDGQLAGAPTLVGAGLAASRAAAIRRLGRGAALRSAALRAAGVVLRRRPRRGGVDAGALGVGGVEFLGLARLVRLLAGGGGLGLLLRLALGFLALAPDLGLALGPLALVALLEKALTLLLVGLALGLLPRTAGALVALGGLERLLAALVFLRRELLEHRAAARLLAAARTRGAPALGRRAAGARRRLRGGGLGRGRRRGLALALRLQDALLLGLHHDRLGAPVAEALLHARGALPPRTGAHRAAGLVVAVHMSAFERPVMPRSWGPYVDARRAPVGGRRAPVVRACRPAAGSEA